MSSSTTGDRRWGTTRRSGMTILGKVTVPKPINLPSQRLENQGLDPNVEIVPKGTLSWGSKSTLNAWGTSSLSPRTESGAGSPSHLSNRPSSGGSLTRPSTAGSDKAHESSSIGWDSNSRPSSASGVFPSNQASVALQRPHSADTRPGSSHLSRFAESVSENSAAWHVGAEKLGVPPRKDDGFSLTSGDFPSLGAESSEKSTGPQDSGPRPSSSSGRSVEDRGVDCTEEANARTGDVNSWRRDNQPYSEDARRHCREDGHLDSRGSQSYPNANFPHQFDSWRGPPVNNHQGGGWYGGNHPYGAPMGPGGFHMDPFPFYPTQVPPVPGHGAGPRGNHVPPVPGHGAGPRGNHATNEKMFRPPMLDSYVHPRMQTRPGFYLGPVPYEGYYGPPMGYGNPSNRDLPFAGRPAGPHAYNKHSGQSGYDIPGNSMALEPNESSHSQETQRPYKVLLKPQDRRSGEDEAKREEFLANRVHNAEKGSQEMHTSKNDKRQDGNEASSEVQPIKAESATPEDSSLIQKIEGLNAKTRTNDGWQNASESNSRAGNSGNFVNNFSERIPRTGHARDSKNPIHYKQGDPASNKNVDLATTGGISVTRRPSQQSQGRADYQTKQTVNNGGNDAWRKTTVMSDSARVNLAAKSESVADINVGDSLDSDSIRKPGSVTPGKLKGESGISAESADPNDSQRSTMRELARQRAQQRQKEEEERARDQRAKALAKLEELDRRSRVGEEGSMKNLDAATNASNPDMLEDPGSLSPAHLPSNSDDVHVPSSLDMKSIVAAAKSDEPTGESGKALIQDAMTSTEYANNVGPTYQQDNLRRDHDGPALKQKRLGYKQKQSIDFDKKMVGNSFPVATTEVPPEVVKEGLPATSGVSTESTFPKRKNNRNGKKKHKVEETTPMNTTRDGFGKETKPEDESIEVRAAGMMFGSVSVPILDIKVSGNSSEQISSFTNEESQSRAKNNWKSQHVRRTQRNPLVNKPAEKFPGNNAVTWAPVHPQQKANIPSGVGSQNTVAESGTSSKSLHQGQGNSKSKRVEIERYVPKPIVKEMTEQNISQNLVTAPERTENVLQKENYRGEGTGILQPPGSTAGKPGSPLKSRHGNSRQGKQGREHGSWHQRGSAASSKALEDGLSVTSNQPAQGTVNHHSSSQTKQMDAGSAEDGWNDGWYMTPETHYSAAEELGTGARQAVAAGKDQVVTIHGKQHASRNSKDEGSSYGDSKKANKRDSNRANMQQSSHGFRQPDQHVASKESRGPRDHVWHTDHPPNINRTGKYVGHENTRDKTYGSQNKDVAGYQHQGSTADQKMTSDGTPAQSQNRSTSKEISTEPNPNSMFPKNTGPGRRFGRGQDPQGGWGSSMQENMHNHNHHHHHHQRPASNRDRQKPNVHYEYKPVGSHTHDGEHNREQTKDSSQTEGPRYREKGQGHQRHGGQKSYQPQRGTVGRNTDHELTGERN